MSQSHSGQAEAGVAVEASPASEVAGGGHSHARYYDEGHAGFETGDAPMTPPEDGGHDDAHARLRADYK